MGCESTNETVAEELATQVGRRAGRYYRVGRKGDDAAATLAPMWGEGYGAGRVKSPTGLGLPL